jgi:Tfp pilus assembly protein PilF
LREGVALHQAGHAAAAAAAYGEVLAFAPGHADALHLLGLVRHQDGDPAAARRLIDQAIAVRPDVAAYHASLAAVLLAAGDGAAAEAAADQACRLAPDQAEPYLARGTVRARAGRLQAAGDDFRQALVCRPEAPEALNNLGAVLLRAGDLEAAAAALDKAIARRPGNAGQLTNLGLVRREQGRLAEARLLFDAAVAADPAQATARANRALALLQAGEWVEGWAEYEWRWQAEGFGSDRPAFAALAWDGSDPAGLTLLLCGEQGYGSVIQFVRYAPLVAARDARVIVECQPPLADLFRRSLTGPDGSVAEVIARGQPLPDFDRYAPLMSLPHLLGTTLATVPATVPYLRADPSAVADWQHRFAARGQRRRVGLAWAGHPGHGNDHNRSLPVAVAADLLAPLLAAHPEVDWISLQVGEAAAVAAALKPQGLIDVGDRLADFAATAALIEALDLVIAVDTAVAHLAGALAKPTWLLLPSVGEWRWLVDRDDTPWYPTMQVFRQRASGDWRELLDRLARRLAAEPIAR